MVLLLDESVKHISFYVFSIFICLFVKENIIDVLKNLSVELNK